MSTIKCNIRKVKLHAANPRTTKQTPPEKYQNIMDYFDNHLAIRSRVRLALIPAMTIFLVCVIAVTELFMLGKGSIQYFQKNLLQKSVELGRDSNHGSIV